jgi:tellurite resistance protein TerC
MDSLLAWAIFAVIVFGMLLIDLGVFHRKAHAVGLREAIAWSLVWVMLSLLFAGGIWWWHGSDDALLFVTAWLVEKSLSLDNIFVFMVIFGYFRVPATYQHRLLFFGILGSLVMRAIFIVAGIAAIERFHWVVYVLGAFLVYTGFKMAFSKGAEVHPERNPVLRLFRRLFPVTSDYREGRFFVKEAARWVATPLFVVLLVVETTDVVFAVDSVPAVLALTTDPFLVYTSNVFAILGLRALYFALHGTMQRVRFLHYGLSTILAFVGGKMLIADLYEIDALHSLAVIGGLLVASVVVSLLVPEPKGDSSPT